MDYKIIGANKDTGEDVTITIDATTTSAAEAAAKKMNLFVERIDLVEKVQPPNQQLAQSIQQTPVVRYAPLVQTIQVTAKIMEATNHLASRGDFSRTGCSPRHWP